MPIEAMREFVAYLDDLIHLEELCKDFIRRLERGEEYDSQVDDVRSWVCDRYPDIDAEVSP
jgi:hypothetical protein